MGLWTRYSLRTLTEFDSCKKSSFSLTNKLFDLTSSNNDPESRARKRPRLENEEDIIDDFHGIIVDLMDILLEKSVSSVRRKVVSALSSVAQYRRIDEFLGAAKVPAPVAESHKQTQVRVCGSVYTVQNTIKQRPRHKRRCLKGASTPHSNTPLVCRNLSRAIDNRNSVPWRHTLKHKYNAQVPLGYRWDLEDNEHSPSLVS